MKKIIFVLSLMFFIIIFSCQKKESPSQPEQILPTKTFTPTFTFTISPIPNSTVIYDFEDGTIMGWSVFQGGTTVTANSQAISFYNNHSLRIDGNFTTSESSGAGVAPSITNIENMILRAQIYIPSDMQINGGSIFVQSGSNWCWQNGEWANFKPGQWNEVIFDSCNPGYTASNCTPDLTDVKRIGVFFQPTSNYTGSVYIDYFTITPYTYTLVKADDSNIQYYGRWDHTDPAVAKSGWGTTYILAGFYGKSLTLRLSAWDTRFAYAIDDFSDHKNFTKIRIKNQKDQYNATPTQTPYLITGLPDGPHTIMLVRTSEGMSGIVNFSGLGLDIGKTLFAPGSRPTRKMEFIGDSITCGSLNEWQGSNPCPEEWGGCISNGDLTFGPMLARMYNAEWMTTCRGGIGMYRNCSGCNPPATMPTVYPKVFFEMTPTPTTPDWDFSSWQADVVVIALGTNDFSPGVPNETSFKNAYSGFLDTLRTNYPNAFILCTEPIPSWVSTTAGIWINDVVQNKGDSKIYYVPINHPPITTDFPLPVSDYAGDNTHPIVSAHEKIANALKSWIDANIKDDLGW